MLPCLTITFSSNAVTLLQRRSFTRKALYIPSAIRRGSTTVATPPEEQVTEENDAIIDSSGLEFLSALGLDTAAATALLRKATTPLDAPHLEALCFVLHTVVRIPVAKLPRLLRNADSEFLNLPIEIISANYKAICSAWPTERQLRDAIISYPDILTSSFPGELKRCMTSLRDIGFSTAQTAAAVVRCPELTKLRRYEIRSSLAQCGISISKIEDNEIFEMLSKNPKFLTPNGSKNLSGILEAVKKATGLTSQQAQHIVARCPNTIFRQEKKHIRRIVDLLLEFGLTQTQIGQAALLYPQLLCRKFDRIERSLALLLSYKVTPTQLAAYPQLFQHHPERILVPRLAFIKKNAPEKLSTLSLATFFSSTDEVFSSTFSKSSEKTYLKYKVKVFVKYQLGNAAAAVAAQDALIGDVSVEFSDDEEESPGETEEVGDNRVAVFRSSAPKQHTAALQKQKGSTMAPLVSKKASESGQKQEKESAGDKDATNGKRKQQQQQQQQRRRFSTRINTSPKQKNNKSQQQQQLQRLTPQQIENSKQKAKN
jgi:mTERF